MYGFQISSTNLYIIYPNVALFHSDNTTSIKPINEKVSEVAKLFIFNHCYYYHWCEYDTC